MLVTSGPAGGQVTPAPSTVVSAAKVGSPVGSPGEELVGRRSRTSRTYLTDDRRAVMTRVFSASVNYRASDGSWRAIDNALDLVDGVYRNRANRFGVRLPRSLAGGVVSVSEGTGALSFSLRDAQDTSAQVGAAKATYPEVFAGVDVSYEAHADALKELITLKAAGARREFVFDLKLSDGLRPSVEASGALAIRDGAGALRMALPAPFMSDAKDRVSHAVRFELARIDRGWRLTVRADDRWLDAPERVFPVAIDPQVFPAGQADCKLDQAAPTTDYCAMNHLAIGGGAGSEKRAALRFDITGAVPPGSTVTHAALGMLLQGQSSSTQGKLIHAHRLTRQIAAGATWNSPWTTAGGDYDPAVICEHCAYVGGSAGGGGVQPGSRAYWNIRNLVAGWADGSYPNDGILLKVDMFSAEANVLTFASSEVAGSEPFIDLRYEQRSGILPAHKYESQQLTDRLSLAVNSASGNLLLRARELTVPGGLGPDLIVSRSFNSKHDQQQLAYGKGWNADSGPDVWIEATPQGDAVYHGPSGFDALFTSSGSTSYTTPPGFNAKLEKTSSGWTYIDNESQRKLTFDSSGRLTRDQDRNNRAVTFAYSGSGRQIDKITDSQGRITTFGYTGGRITQMTDSAGRLYKYFYNTSGELEKSTDPDGGDTLFMYDASGLRLITTPAGRKTKITYHGAGSFEGRVESIVRVTNPTAAFGSMTGPTTQFAYTQNRDGSGTSTVTDPNTNQVSTIFDKLSRPTQTTDGAGRVTKGTYTTNSNVESYTVAGNTGTTPNSKLLYDADNNLTGANTPTSSATDPASCTSTTCVMSTARYGESAGVAATVPGRQYLLTSTTNAQGRSKTLSYDANGNPKTIASSLGTITLNYDSASPGKLDSITDQRAKTTSYSYDSAGNLKQITPPMPLGSTTLTYTASLSRIATVTDGNAKVRTLSYDNLDRLTKITYSDASYVQFVYDKDGNLTVRNDTVGGNSTYRYDELSRVLSETLPDSTTNTYTYDAASNLKTLTDAGGTVTYGYDAANRNTSVAHSTQNIVLTPTDQETGSRSKLTTDYPNGVTVVRKADHAGRLEEIKATKGTTLIEHLKYEYLDATYGQGVLRVRAVDVLAGKTTRYQYDDLDRLRRARTYTTGTTAPAESSDCATDARLACYEYGLDAAGNRTQRTVSGSSVTNSTTTYAYNDANQLSTRTAGSSVSSYNYDANGNHTTRTGAAPRTLGYNLRDQTTNLAGTTMGYLGAGQDQLVSEGPTTLQHNILGLARRNASYYTRGESGTPLTQRSGSDREYYIQDALGSTIRTTDQAGATKATYAYDPDGNTTTTTGTSTNPLRYAAGYQTTAGLYHYGQRYYDPTDARWTQPDPLDQASDLREANKYVYVGANAINLIDPTGFHSAEAACKENAGVGAVAGATGGAVMGAGIGAAPAGMAGAGIGCFTGVMVDGLKDNSDPVLRTTGEVLDVGGKVKDGAEITYRVVKKPAETLIDSILDGFGI